MNDDAGSAAAKEKRQPVKFTVSLYEDRRRLRRQRAENRDDVETENDGRRPTSDNTRAADLLNIDAHGRETWSRQLTMTNETRASLRVLVGDVLHSGIEVLNRNDRLPKLSAPGYTCNLLQMFNWLRRKYDEAKFASCRAEDSDGDIYEDINGEEVVPSELLPLDFYAELLDDDLFRLPDNNSCRALRLAKHRRHVVVPSFWSRGGEILRLSGNTTVNFRRRVQRVDVHAGRRQHVVSVDVDMLLPLEPQRDTLGASLASATQDERCRGGSFSLTMKSVPGGKYGRSPASPLSNPMSNFFFLFFVAVRHDCDTLVARKPMTTVSTDVVRMLRVDQDTRRTLELGFLPWAEFPYLELSFDYDRVDGNSRWPSVQRLSLAENCWPSLETIDRAKSVLSLIAELVRLTDDTAHRLRFSEFVGKLATRPSATTTAVAFNAHLDKFARKHVDPTFQRLINNRTLWCRLVEEMASNTARLPKSVALSVAVIARNTVLTAERDTNNEDNDDGVGDNGANTTTTITNKHDLSRQYWASIDLHHRLSTIRLLGRAEVETRDGKATTAIPFLLFAVRSTNGAYTLVRCLPCRTNGDSGLRFVDRSDKLTVARQTCATRTSEVRGELVRQTGTSAAHTASSSNSWDSLSTQLTNLTTVITVDKANVTRTKDRKFSLGKAAGRSASTRLTVKCLDLLAPDEDAKVADTAEAGGGRLSVRVQLKPNGDHYVVVLRNSVDGESRSGSFNQIYSDALQRVRQTLTDANHRRPRPLAVAPLFRRLQLNDEFLASPRPKRYEVHVGKNEAVGVKPTAVRVYRISPRLHNAKLWPAQATAAMTALAAKDVPSSGNNGHYLRNILRVVRAILHTTQRARLTERRPIATKKLDEKICQLKTATERYEHLVDDLLLRDHDDMHVQLRRPLEQRTDKRAMVETARRMLHLVVELSEILLEQGHVEAYRGVTIMLKEVAEAK